MLRGWRPDAVAVNEWDPSGPISLGLDITAPFAHPARATTRAAPQAASAASPSSSSWSDSPTQTALTSRPKSPVSSTPRSVPFVAPDHPFSNVDSDGSRFNRPGRRAPLPVRLEGHQIPQEEDSPPPRLQQRSKPFPQAIQDTGRHILGRGSALAPTHQRSGG